jgi:PPOX class probable F420-dependent enzyme
MPASYGLEPARAETDLLPWSWAEERLAQARNYWLATVGADGRPHVVPIWGVWTDRQLLFGTARTSRKAHNLRRSAAAAVHLESGDEVVILEGKTDEVVEPDARARLGDMYQAKYAFRPQVDNGETVIFRFTFAKAMGWREADFPSSATCWEMD